MDRDKRCTGHHQNGGLLVGGALITLGAAFLLAQLGLLGDYGAWDFWPLLLVLAGAMKLFDRHSPPDRIWGLLLVGAGVVFQLHYLDLLHLEWKLVWPVLIIVVGLFVLGSTIYRVRHRHSAPRSSANALAVFVVLVRRIVSPALVWMSVSSRIVQIESEIGD